MIIIALCALRDLMASRRSRPALIPQRCLPATLGATRHTGSYQRVLSRPLAYLRQPFSSRRRVRAGRRSQEGAGGARRSAVRKIKSSRVGPSRVAKRVRVSARRGTRAERRRRPRCAPSASVGRRDTHEVSEARSCGAFGRSRDPRASPRQRHPTPVSPRISLASLHGVRERKKA